MPRQDKILIEVMYKADYCLPCYYMDEMVEEVLPKYAGLVEYRRVYFMKAEGKNRFLELSCSLFGKEGVYKYFRLAPVPSLWINGELFFDAIPPQFELEDAIEEVLNSQ
jgi:thiol-disulfide isomerase/thioredoxin